MIERITLNKILPKVFDGHLPEGKDSEIWLKELTFTRGESCLVEAASGRGKSSLCAYLYGSRHDYEGTIIWQTDNNTPLNLKDESTLLQLKQRGIAMMFQEMRIFPELNAVENVLLKNRLTDYNTEAEIRRMLEALSLGSRIDAPCGRLSIGQQQRVAFVRLLCQPADFCILDEPVSHLDTGNAEIMGEMLSQWQAKEGCGVLVTSIGYTLPYHYNRTLKL